MTHRLTGVARVVRNRFRLGWHGMITSHGNVMEDMDKKPLVESRQSGFFLCSAPRFFRVAITRRFRVSGIAGSLIGSGGIGASSYG